MYKIHLKIIDVLLICIRHPYVFTFNKHLFIFLNFLIIVLYKIFSINEKECWGVESQNNLCLINVETANYENVTKTSCKLFNNYVIFIK